MTEVHVVDNHIRSIGAARGSKGMVSQFACSVGPKLSVGDDMLVFYFWWVVQSVMADAAMIDVEITSSIGEEILKASVEEINSRCRSSSFASQTTSLVMSEYYECPLASSIYASMCARLMYIRC